MGFSANKTNMTARVCKVNGIGPNGTVIQAETVIKATDKPQNAIDAALP